MLLKSRNMVANTGSPTGGDGGDMGSLGSQGYGSAGEVQDGE